MKQDRTDFADRTLVMSPRPQAPRRVFDPASSTLRMTNAPIRQQRPAPRPPERSPSVPALTVDADPSLEIATACARFRKGRTPWAVIAGAIVVAGAIASLAVVGRGTPPSAKAAAGGSVETQLERERVMRSARAAGQWVEMPQDNAKPCDDATRAPNDPPCAPKPTP